MSVKLKSFSIGSIAFVIFAMLRGVIPLHNMEFFMAACVVFAGTIALSYLLLNKGREGMNPVWERIWSIAAIVMLGIWLILFYCNETNVPHSLIEADLIRRTFPLPLWLVLMIVGVGICLFILRKEPGEKGLRIRKKIRAVVSFLFTIGTSIQFYAPNIFQDVQGGPYHSHAYTNSIINACWLIPYSKHLEPLYGHYAIVFMPVLKFMHRFLNIDYLTGTYILCAVLAGISILLFIYILNFFAKRDLIFYLGMFAIGEYYFMLMQGGVYLQVHPHRMIFPILLCALALHEHKKQKKYNILAVVILTLSFVWSTEVGIVTMASFALFRWVGNVCDGEAFSVRKALLLLREMLIYCLLPFVFAYIIVNGYNLLAGGALLDFKEFMFPLISDWDYIDFIELPLPDATHAWIGSAILFMGFVFPALFQIFFPQKVEKGFKAYYFLLGIMCLGLTLYYINRPAEACLFINLFLLLIMQVIIFQKSQTMYLEWKAHKDSLFAKPNRFILLSLRIVTVLILFIMAFDGIYSMPKAWKKSSETIWKRDELMEFAEYVYVQIPPDAMSFGEGVPELMSLIDRDTHLHTTEWSIGNTPPYTQEMVRHELEDEQWFFCSQRSLAYLQTDYPGLTDNFIMHEVFEYNGYEFAFYRKEE